MKPMKIMKIEKQGKQENQNHQSLTSNQSLKSQEQVKVWKNHKQEQEAKFLMRQREASQWDQLDQKHLKKQKLH